MASDLTLFWILWSFTLLIISYTVFESLTKEQNVYGAPLLYGLMFSYFYVFQVFVVANFMGYLLEPWMLEIGQAITITCFSAFLIGWKIGIKINTKKIKTNDINLNFNYKKITKLGDSAAIKSIPNCDSATLRIWTNAS